MLSEIVTFLEVSADIATIAASGIAVYLFVAKGAAISNALSVLINYSHQVTLAELKEKLERLNDYNVNGEEGYEKVIIIFHEMIGQINGNERLNERFSDLVVKLEAAVSEKQRLTEPRKRSLVSEIRERIRHLNVADNAIVMDGGKR
ncbi:hypothetical protein [Ectopseudomonas mendocina]|uniref:hypothetical protein n=1 Tax=Ectopseudomonas mendocina TaxID=300 RepID=UPI0005AB2A7E|nr:hypothetical protein [Pseudomonas mendocina]